MLCRSNSFHDQSFTDTIPIPQVTWGSHMQEAKNVGVMPVMFGAGVGVSTHGTGNPPTDDYFWIQKVQQYFKTGVVPLPELIYEINIPLTQRDISLRRNHNFSVKHILFLLFLFR